MPDTTGGTTGSRIIPTTHLVSERATDKYVNWIRQEFAPLTLATPELTLQQIVENAVRYWNTHSAYRITTMFDYTPGETFVQLNTQFKSVVEVLPARKSTWIWSDHPLWTLLGITVIDNVTGDLIMLSESFRNYRIYVGADMRWQFERSEDPNTPGKLFLTNVPSGVEALAVVGTKRITIDEDIKQEYILDWLLQYMKALTKQSEGNILRKSSIINIKNDGQEMMNEGKEEMKMLKEALAKEGRWTAFLRRG